MLKHICKFMIPLLFIAIFSGCWNRKEINQLGIASSVAYDIEGENLKVTTEILKSYKPKGSSGGGGGANEALFASATGSTFYDSLRNITESFDRKLFYPHLTNWFLSEGVAAKGIGGLLDFTLRDHEMRLSPYVVVVKGSKASEIMNQDTGIEEMLMGYMIGLSRAQGATSKSVFIDVRHFLHDYYSEGKHPVAGVIEKTAPEKTSEKGEDSKDGKKEGLMYQGLAVFNKDCFKGYLNGDEALYYNFILNEVKSTLIITPSPDKKGFNTVEAINSKGDVKVKLNGNQAFIKIKLAITGVIGEESGQSNIDDNGIIKLVEMATSEKVKQGIEMTIKKVQKEFCVDIFGFGNNLHNSSPQQWKIVKSYWDSIFANAQVEVSVSTDIIRIGDITKPLKYRSE